MPSDSRDLHTPDDQPKPAAEGAAPPSPEGAGDEDRDWVEVRESWVGETPEPMQVEPYASVLTPPAPAVEAANGEDASSGQAVPAKPRSVPPPLPASVRPLAGPRADLYAAYALAASRAAPSESVMLERLAASDYDGALRAAEHALRSAPADGEALQCRELCRSELRKLYLLRLGDLDLVPSLAIDATALRAIDVDVRAGLVLARVDGASTVRAIAESGVVDEVDALRVLSELFLSGVIALARG